MKITNEALIKTGLFGVLFSHLGPVSAHSGHDKLADFSEGLAHPWLGLDHLLMAFAVGLIARSIPSRQMGLLPLCFTLAMFAGFYFPENTVLSAYFELGISVCLVSIGLLLNFRPARSLSALLPIVVIAGLCHGAIHAAEVVNEGERVVTLAGLLTATLLIQVLGVRVGRYAHQRPRLQFMTGLACLVSVTLPV